MDSLLTKRLAFIGVVSLITFLSYGPPVLFRYIDPGALGRKDFITFNLLVVCIWTCYLQACFTDPGHVSAEGKVYESGGDFPVDGTKSRWCRRCSQPKPPRAHHCKICQRYLVHKSFRRGVPDKCSGVFPKWTITALGRSIVYLTAPFHTSFASCSTPFLQ